MLQERGKARAGCIGTEKKDLKQSPPKKEEDQKKIVARSAAVTSKDRSEHTTRRGKRSSPGRAAGKAR